MTNHTTIVPDEQTALFQNLLRRYSLPMNLADLRRQHPELFPASLCSWAEHYDFFTTEYFSGHEDLTGHESGENKASATPPTAITLALIMAEAIQSNASSELLCGRYFRTRSAISSSAIVVIRCTPDKKIEIDSWAKRSRHQYLADWRRTA